jgi:hypothetical protein
MATPENRHCEGFLCSFYDSWARRCPAEAPRLDTFKIFYHAPTELEKYWRDPAEWFELEQIDGPYKRIRKRADVERIDENRKAVVFRGIPPGGKFRLIRHFHESSKFVLSDGAALAEVEKTCKGGKCTELKKENKDAAAVQELSYDEIEEFGEFDPDLYALRLSTPTERTKSSPKIAGVRIWENQGTDTKDSRRAFPFISRNGGRTRGRTFRREPSTRSPIRRWRRWWRKSGSTRFPTPVFRENPAATRYGSTRN